MYIFIGAADYYALNHYSTRMVTNGVDPDPNYNPDAEYVTSVDASWPKAIASWLIVTNIILSLWNLHNTFYML